MVVNNDPQSRITTLSKLLINALDAQETERRALSSVLQEDIGQTLASVSLKLRVLENMSTDSQYTSLIGDIRTLVADALKELEKLHMRLYPPALQSQGIVPAIENYAHNFAKDTHVSVSFVAEQLIHKFEHSIELAIFRMLQLIFEEIRLDSYASRVSVFLWLADRYVHLAVEDNGADLSPETLSGQHIALIIQWSSILGGSCMITSNLDGGVRFHIALPLLIGEPDAGFQTYN